MPKEPAGRWSILLLGPMIVSRDGVAVKVGPAMVRRFLALLALHSGLVVTRQEIVDVLWDGNPPPTYVNLIHVYASRLRAQLRDGDDAVAIASLDHGAYQLHLDDDAVDLARFDRLLLAARQAVDGGDVAAATAAYEGALGCWRGPVLADIEPGFEHLPVVVGANQRRIAGVIEYAQLCGRLGRHELAVDALRHARQTAPLHEGLHAQLMLALANAGDRASALTTYEETRRRLADELGVDPGNRLQSVHLQLLREGEDDVHREVAPAAPSAGPDPTPQPAEQKPPAIAAGNKAEPAARPAAEPPTSTPERVPGTPRHRYGTWAAVATMAFAAALILVVAIVRVGEPMKPAAAPRQAPSEGPSVTTRIHWDWVYSGSLGFTTSGVQWASARISGLANDACAGFRFRVTDGDDHGVLAAVCGTKWELESRLDDDFQHVDADLPPAGQLYAMISDTNVLTVKYGGATYTWNLTPGAYSGRHIVAAIYQGDNLHVTIADIHSNALPSPTTAGPGH